MTAQKAATIAAVLGVIATFATGCEWRGANSMSLPGTQGGGPGETPSTGAAPSTSPAPSPGGPLPTS